MVGDEKLIRQVSRVIEGRLGKRLKGKNFFMEYAQVSQEFFRQISGAVLKQLCERREANRRKVKCGCGHQMKRFDRAEKRYLRTSGGEAEIERFGWRCGKCGIWSYPLDQELGIPAEKNIMPDLAERLCYTAVSCSYRETSEIVQKLLGVEVSSKEVQVIVEERGGKVPEKLLGKREMLLDKERGYITTEGILVHWGEGQGKWKEIKVGSVFSQWVEVSKNRSEVIDRSYVGRVAELGRFEEDLWREAKGRGILEKEEIVYIIDGAEGLKSFDERYLKPLGPLKKVTRILDWYHLSNKVRKRLREMVKDEWRRAGYVEEVLEDLWEGQLEAAIKVVEKLRPRSVEGQKAQELLLGYFYRNREWIVNYEVLQQEGYYVGSGIVEKANDILVARRMKKRGMTWKGKGAEGVLKLRTLKLNGNWERYWENGLAA